MRISLIVLSLISLAAIGESKKAAVKPSEATKAVVPAQSVTTAAVQTTSVAPNTSVVTASAPSESGVMGFIDLRPSYSSQIGEFHSENTLELGYKFSNTWNLVYDQEFQTNLYNPADEGGLNLTAQDGYARLRGADLLKSADETLTLSYELRAFAPTKSSRRDAGMVTAIRNYAKLAKKLSDRVTMTLMEVPIAHIYTRASYNGKPNPSFENRIYLITDVDLTDKLSLSFPIQWNAQKLRSAEGNWDNFIGIYPEVGYTLTENYSVGAAYYNDTSLMSSDLATFQIGDGLKNGVVQLFFKASL